MTLKKALKQGAEQLKSSGIREYQLDSFYLLEHVTGISRAMYLAYEDKELTKPQQEEYWSLIEQRGNRVPLQHLLGYTEFMGLTFKVNDQVLIPRQDTEILVEVAIKWIENYLDRRTDSIEQVQLNGELELSILDMCTGSGCIGISLQHYGNLIPTTDISINTKMVAVDISKNALEVATENATRNNVDIEFIQSDLFENLSSRSLSLNSNSWNKEDIQGRSRFNMILSNPPYIPTQEIQSLEEEVKDHDPILALDGKDDGLYFYKKIIKESPDYLEDQGVLILEAGWNQGEIIAQLMTEQGFGNVKMIKDLTGINRVIIGEYTEN